MSAMQKSTPKNSKMNLRSTASLSTPANPDSQSLTNLLSGVNDEGESFIDIIRKVVKETP